MSKNGKRTSLSSRTEADYLHRSPRNAERLREAIARADAGKESRWMLRHSAAG